MRTKTVLLAAAAIAAGAISSQAQSNVYSANIVGYVNIGITNGVLSLVANPLIPSGNDYNITNTVKLADPGSDNTTLYKWNTATVSWDTYTWFDGFGWFPDVNIPLGEGFFLLPSSTQTITLVGEVKTGTVTNSIAGSSLTLKGNMVPVAGPAPGGTIGHDNDNLYVWDASLNSWNTITYFDGYGWFDGTAETNGPSLKVGQGFFYQNGGGALNWVQTLNP